MSSVNPSDCFHVRSPEGPLGFFYHALGARAGDFVERFRGHGKAGRNLRSFDGHDTNIVLEILSLRKLLNIGHDGSR
jgi:hypothetical protein